MPLKKYDLFVQVQRRWKKVAVIEADGHSAAFRQAMSQLPPAHYDKPIRLEQQQELTRRGGGAARR